METVLEFQQLAVKFNLNPRYEGNPLVNAMCVGLIDHKDIQKGSSKRGRKHSHVCWCENRP